MKIDNSTVDALFPVASMASALRAQGIRIVGSAEAIRDLEQLSSSGNEKAAVVLGNLFIHGHPEIAKREPNELEA